MKIKSEEFFLFTEGSVCRAKMVHRKREGNLLASLFWTSAYDIILDGTIVGGIVFTWCNTNRPIQIDRLFVRKVIAAPVDAVSPGWGRQRCFASFQSATSAIGRRLR